MSLETERKTIDLIDDEIVRLLALRADAAREISQLKLAAGLPILDRERETHVFSRVRHLAAGRIAADAIDQIYEAIMTESRRVQAAVRDRIATEGAVQ